MGPPPWCAIVVYIFNACRVYANLKPELGGEGWWTTQVVGRGGGTPSAWPGAGMPSYLMPMTGLTYDGTKLFTDQGSGTRGGGIQGQNLTINIISHQSALNSSLVRCSITLLSSS